MQQRLFALSEMEKLNETFNAMDPIISFFSIYPVLAMFFNKRVMRGRQGGDSASVLCCHCCFALLSFVVFCCLLLSFSNDEIPAEALSRQSYLAAQYNQKVVLIVSQCPSFTLVGGFLRHRGYVLLVRFG